MVQRLTSILLVIGFMAPAGVAYWALQHQRQQVKRTVKHFLESKTDRKDLVHFRFSQQEAENELIWEHEKEFEYRGEMYDVVSREVQGDSLHLWCWWDHEETNLNKKLRRLTAEVMQGNPNCRDIQYRVGWLFQTVLKPDEDRLASMNTLESTPKAFFCDRLHPTSSLPPPNPPPDPLT